MEETTDEYKLRGRPDPQWDLTREAPWHRAALRMLAMGATTAQVADTLGHVPVTINNLIRQDWFQKALHKEMKSQGKGIMDLFESQMTNTFITLIEMRDDPNTPAAVKEKICQSIINRRLGTPVQQIRDVTEEAHSDDPNAEAARLEAEIKTFSRN